MPKKQISPPKVGGGSATKQPSPAKGKAQGPGVSKSTQAVDIAKTVIRSVLEHYDPNEVIPPVDSKTTETWL